jgi:hypothetical protein
MSNKKQTAVEWLERRYYFTKGQLIDTDFQKAKEMEKQNTCHFGAKCCLMTTQKKDWTLENLYNETFNSEENENN